MLDIIQVNVPSEVGNIDSILNHNIYNFIAIERPYAARQFLVCSICCFVGQFPVVIAGCS